jgi:hypothetical protein
LTRKNLRTIFGIDVIIGRTDKGGYPYIVPQWGKTSCKRAKRYGDVRERGYGIVRKNIGGESQEEKENVCMVSDITKRGK